MATETYEYSETETSEFMPYRAVSKAAVVSLLLSLISIVAVFSSPMLVLPLAGVVSGLIALLQIRRYPKELTGWGVAIFGVVLSGLLLCGGATLHALVYLNEVPDGYVRVSFSDLQPTSDHPDWPFSPRAAELNGKRVFIKGYVYPDGQQHGIKQFVLVRDLGTCCFGGQPKLTHMVLVTLRDPQRISYSMKRRKLTGTFRVDAQLRPVSGVDGVYFQLEADDVR
jgi:hypothetical protein